MPISLELIVERELAARAKRAVFDAWGRLTRPILRRRVERRWLSWLRFNGLLLRALLRVWAQETVQGQGLWPRPARIHTSITIAVLSFKIPGLFLFVKNCEATLKTGWAEPWSETASLAGNNAKIAKGSMSARNKQMCGARRKPMAHGEGAERLLRPRCTHWAKFKPCSKSVLKMFRTCSNNVQKTILKVKTENKLANG